MPSIYRHRFLATAAVLLPLVLLAQQAQAEAVRTVTIAGVAGVVNGQPHFSGPDQRVIDEGWLAAQLRQRGIRLAWVPVASDVGATVNEAFSAHRIDFASYGDLPSVILNASGTRTQVVVPDGRGSDTFLIVPVSSKARSLQDLRGKRIAVHRGRPWYLPFLRLVQHSGMKPSDFTIVNMDLQPSVAALVSGNIDGMFSMNAYSYTDRGLARIIWSSKGQIDKKIRAELWGAKTFIDAHPDLTQLIATAFVRAQYWESQDGNRAAVIHEGTLAGRSAKAVEQGYADATLAWKDVFTPVPDEVVLDHYRRTVAYAEDRHLIRGALRAEDLLQPRFVITALHELKLDHYWSQVALDPRALLGKTYDSRLARGALQ